MKRVGLVLSALVLLALTVVPGLAGAGPKAIKPVLGDYGGTGNQGGESYPANLTLSKKGGKLTISFVTGANYLCHGNEGPGFSIGFDLPLQGTSFHGTDSHEDLVLGDYTSKIKGEWVSSTTIKGTASAAGTTNLGGVETACKTGNVKFTLTKNAADR
jgi:hypothetical protein